MSLWRLAALVEQDQVTTNFVFLLLFVKSPGNKGQISE